MSYPIDIKRGAKPNLLFADTEELRHWIEAEANAWRWLTDEATWSDTRRGNDGALRNKVLEALWSPLAELQGLTAPGGTLDDPVVAAATNVLSRAYADGPVPIRDDPAVDGIIAATKEDPSYALGMLAQALGIVVGIESAAAFAGRHAWIAKLPGALAAGLEERLSDLKKGFEKADVELKNRQMNAATAQVLEELRRARRTNGLWVLGLAGAALVWIGLAVYGIGCIHRLTLSTSTQPEWGPETAERAALFLFLMTAFSWGMRWIGRMIKDAWAAGQSAARRYTALKVVLDDTAARLVKNTEKDWDRVRAEIFGDIESNAAKPTTENKKDKDAEPDGNGLDVAKKVVALLKEMQSLAPGSGKH